jgi:hypothetical protein
MQARTALARSRLDVQRRPGQPHPARAPGHARRSQPHPGKRCTSRRPPRQPDRTTGGALRPRIQRTVRDLLNDDTITDREKASQLLALADHLGLARQPAPEPLPPINPDDIHQICWTAVIPADLTGPEIAEPLPPDTPQ